MTLRTTIQDTLDRTTETPRLLIVSDYHVGSMLASVLQSTTAVSVVTDSDAVAVQTPDSVPVTVSEVTAVETLQAATDATAAVVALRSDRELILVTQLLRTHFDLSEIVALLNDPERRAAIEDLTTAVVCVATCLSAEAHQIVETTIPAFERT